MPAEGRSGARRSATDNPVGVRVWGEVGATVCVDPDNRNFIRFTFGHERIAPDDDPETLERYEALVYEYCEMKAEKRMRQLVRLTKAIANAPEQEQAPSTKKARSKTAKGSASKRATASSSRPGQETQASRKASPARGRSSRTTQ